MPANPEQFETLAATVATSASSPPGPGASPEAGERFAPGVLLASRYRIVSRLGRGGMGEVFRADDLVLRQPVALKFLPQSAKNNVNLLTRFYDEVRIARQISHKNVCRVYDIGEVDGQPYLSMEYIDGEDLASLLRRIGRLPADKATEFARKLCAGVAAAHSQGVLHRDLKPANVMIDSRGELRVTDFGLAAVAEQLKGDEIRNGTPAYMAPEQLSGTEVSAQSDLYAVGLILYEMFTGKMAFQADTLAEMTRLRQESRIAPPSTLTRDLDESVERAILNCLESNPRMRPASALALSAMLPGGDPLAAALAEGVTPSPELVAEAGSHEGLSPKVAILALAGILAGLTAFCVAMPRVHTINLIPLEKPPEVLTARARDILESLGYTERGGDSAGEFYGDGGMVRFARSKGRNMQEWEREFSRPPSAIGYWYRQARGHLLAESISSNGKVSIGDPPTNIPGMLTVVMDIDGGLRRFVAVPPEHEPAPPAADAAAVPNWQRLFEAAKLDFSKFTPVAPEWSASVMTDARAAWTGFYKDRTDLPVRVEAAAFHNRPVYFEVQWPWTPALRLARTGPDNSFTLRSAGYFGIGAVLFLAALWIAHYNWTAGRADMRGAARTGIFCGAMSLISWVFHAHHVASDAEQRLIANALANAAFVCVQYWLFYLALEPWVRRYWPQTMITWSRVVAGRWNDPLVGRDLLFGTFFGIVYVLTIAAYGYANMRYGVPLFAQFGLEALKGMRPVVDHAAGLVYSEIGGCLFLMLTLFLVRAVIRKQWVVAVVWVTGWVAARFLRGTFIDSPELAITTGAFFLVLYSVLVVIILRYGFFALVVATLVLDSLIAFYLTPDFSAWYGESSMAVVIVTVAVAVWAFRRSLGSRSPWSPARLERT